MSVTHSADEILALLSLLDEQIADDLETETLDFKECPSEVKLKELAKETAICLGNVSGGTIVFGVKERALGLDKAIVGIDFAPDLEALKATIYDSIDPKLPVQFEWLAFGLRRLLLMHVYPSMPPYTTTSGKGWIRVGKDCKPMTGSLLRQLREKVGLSDPTVLSVLVADPYKALSPAAIDILRRELKTMGAPADLLACNDADLSVKMGLVRDGKLTLGGLLVAGREEIIAVHAPNHEWKYSRMRTDTDFETPPVSGRDCILSALEKLMLLLGQQNPVTTVPSGLFHAEFPQYPVISLREAYPYDDRRLKEKLSSLETNLLVVEHSGTGRGTIYRLSRRASAILNESVTYDMTRRLDREAIKVRILSLLKDRPLRNSEIRDFTDLDRQQVYRVMKELERDNLILQIGYGQSAKWHLKQSAHKQ